MSTLLDLRVLGENLLGQFGNLLVLDFGEIVALLPKLLADDIPGDVHGLSLDRISRTTAALTEGIVKRCLLDNLLNLVSILHVLDLGGYSGANAVHEMGVKSLRLGKQ